MQSPSNIKLYHRIIAISCAPAAKDSLLGSSNRWILIFIRKMTMSYAFALIILSLMVSVTMCQTFQYSHGWTNGKRSTFSQLEDMMNTNSKSLGQVESVFLNCDLHKLKLLLQGNVNAQIPCELVTSSKRSFPEVVLGDQFHREHSTSNAY